MILLTSRTFQKRDFKRFGANIWSKFVILDISKLIRNRKNVKGNQRHGSVGKK